MTADDRHALTAALEPARREAYPRGEYVGQESFMTASEIRGLARRAGIGGDVSVADLCCGTAGPGRLLAGEQGCRYLGVDASASAVELARTAARDLSCRFEVLRVPPLPPGPFDVVLLLETMLAFREKQPLLAAVAAELGPGGRFAFTVEEGMPLTPAERAMMPGADTVWPVPLPELSTGLERVGLVVASVEELSLAHRERARALAESFTTHRAAIGRRLGSRVVDHLVASHRTWVSWLGSGRIRKLAVVAVAR